MNLSVSKAQSTVNISYNVSFPEAQAHYADIEMHISGLKQNILDLKMPVWTPGSYLIREFAKNIESFSAAAGNRPVVSPKINKNTWRITTKGIPAVTIKYRVYANEISVRTSYIDASHGFLSTSGIFIYPANMLHHPSTIHIKPYKDWAKVSTSLEMVNGDPFTRVSPNFDILFDSPIEVGNQDVFGFDASGVKYEICMYGGGNYDKERLKKDLHQIVEQETAIYGENPNKHYVFIVHNHLKGGGGLEHLSSTVLGASRDAYSSEKGYQNFLSLAAHEHFHLWNVKRLRPIVLGPFDYDNENYTTNLWIAEGFTEYYQGIAVRRTKLYPPENYLDVLAGEFNILENLPGKNVQTVAESSFDAWIKAYRPNENSANTTISYYNKGAIIAMMLDLEIINSSKGIHSLDDVMKYMYTEYYKTQKRGYTDAEFKKGFEKFAGKKLDDFYKKYINGLTPIDYDKYLGYAGYKITDELATNNDAALGVTTVTAPNKKVIVTSVIRGTAAYIDGINVNDELIAVDNNAITDAATMLNDKKPGDKIEVSVMRDGLPLTLPVTLLKSTRVKYKIDSVDNPTPEQLLVRKKWLSL
ncbi:M61 family metallopeptidase [Mucilaginibacter pocheonensis]|uniref:Metalloprotease with PDZ domain n=1 Tax=Mucilaginibacter pocheonensis TaxID=398050 RepID=A0ABU1T9S2_9SPHI|nr:PDZ domain-containing protein [Mucilaginibacter pocheonensis]MDR6941960.1 putative metalloprotease with PDZ domain [Mucilaginibacter pocheonensis]